MSKQKDKCPDCKGTGMGQFYFNKNAPCDTCKGTGQSEQKDRKLRALLWATHPCSGKYCDDGELQCGCFLPPIDFLRDKPEDIETKIPLHNAQLLEQKKLDRPDREKIKGMLGKLFGMTPLTIDEVTQELLPLFPDIVAKLKQAVKDTRDGKDIDLPEELYEVFCSIQNQAIEEAKREEQSRHLASLKLAVKQERERIIAYLESMVWVFNPKKERFDFLGIIQELRSGFWRDGQALKENKEEISA